MPRLEAESSTSALPPYWRCARFGDDQDLALRVYLQAEELVRTDPRNDLSIFRAHSSELSSLVLALGEPPSQRLDRQIRRLLAAGEPAALADDVLQVLYAYRQRAIQLGPREERHYGDH